MDYVQPLGGAPGDPYVNENPGGGIDGSVVPAAAIEHAQREIVNVITQAGLPPDGGDLTQLFAALAIGVQQSAFLAWRATDQAGFGPNTFTRVVANLESFDSKGDYDTATGLFTCATAGLYFFAGAFKIPSGIPSGTEITSEIWINAGAIVRRGNHQPVDGAGHTAAAISVTLANLAVADTVELRGWQSSAGTVSAQAINTWFAGYRLGKGV